jgi:hypothetical protein
MFNCAGDDPHEGRFAGAVFPDEPDPFPFFQVPVKIGEERFSREFLGEMFQMEHRESSSCCVQLSASCVKS